MGRIGCRGSIRRRTAVVAVLCLLDVEVVRWARWANACHGTDRTDTTCRRVQDVQEQNPTMKKTNVLAVLVAGTGVIAMGIIPSALAGDIAIPTSTAGTAAPTPTAAAVPGLASFVGEWEGHERNLVILRTGSGHVTYANEMACPSCSEAEAPTGTVDFTLTSVANDVATGRVDASSDEQNVAVGSDVTAKLAAGSPSGQVLQVGMGRMSRFFCNRTSVGQCGA
jgi:hypothetical protein